MCVFKTPKAATVEVPSETVYSDYQAPSTDSGAAAAQSARLDERKRRVAAGAANTVVTGGAGLAEPANTTARKQQFGA